jgi:hypothetical protein
MLAEDVSPNRFEQAKIDARSLIDQVVGKGVATVIVFDREARWVGDTREISSGELLGLVKQLDAGGSGYAIEEALALANATAFRDLPVEIIVLTDGAFQLPPEVSSEYPIVWRKYGDANSNQAVMKTAVSVVGDNAIEVFAKVVNFSNVSVSRSLKLILDGRVAAEEIISFQPEGVISHVWKVPSVSNLVSVSLGGTDVLPSDDLASTSIMTSGDLKVLLVTSGSGALQRALAVQPRVELVVINPEEYQPVTGFDLYVFHDYLPERWPNGNVFVVEPPLRSNLLYVEGSVPVQGIIKTESEELVADLDFRGVRWGSVRRVDLDTEKEFHPLITAGDAPILVKGDTGYSTILILCADLDEGNLAQHPVFPILVSKISDESRRMDLPIELELGMSLSLSSVEDLQQIKVLAPSGDRDILVSLDAMTGFRFMETGIFQLSTYGLDGKGQDVFIGISSGDEVESDLRLGGWLSASGTVGDDVVTYPAETMDLTPLLLVIGIVLLLLEAWIAWR